MRCLHALRLPACVLLIAFAAVRPACAKFSAEGEPLPDSLLAGLPADVGSAARAWLRLGGKEAASYRALSPADLERQILVALAADPRAADFILGRLDREPVQTAQETLKVVAFEPFWAGVQAAVPTLQGLASSCRDADLSLACLDTARRLEVKALRATLTGRLEQARARGDAAAVHALEAADERWIMLERGAALPPYMRRPPPVFSASPAGRPVRVVGFGDFGTGSSAQRQVAASIVRMAAAHPFDLGLTVGDNFYETGMTSPEDPRWRDWWENLYGPAHVTVYPTLGNHEWLSDEGAAAEIQYRSPSWHFPSPYYAYTAGPVEFIAVDTTEISAAQTAWLKAVIAASTSRWKVVYGHHPIFAPDKEGKALRSMQELQAHFWPLLRGRVDAYLCGHQHVMARMQARDGVHFFMSGGGGAPLGKVSRKAPGVRYAESAFGFMTLEADEATMTVTLYDADGLPTDSEVVRKAPAGA